MVSRSVLSKGKARIGASAIVALVATAIVAVANIPVSHALTAGQTAQAFVCNFGGNSVTIYPAGSGINPANVTTVAGENSELESPVGVALAPSAVPGLTRFYLTNCGKDCGGVGSSSINLYEVEIPAGGGVVDPTATGMITGDNTGLDEPLGVALDSSENVYVANDAGGDSGFGSVTIYPAGSDGDVTPSETIAGRKTGFDFPTGIALDSSGNIYVANCGENCGGNNASSVEVFAAGSSGNVTPSTTIIGTNTGLVNPFGITLDSGGNIYVANELAGQNGRGSITIYPAGSKGNAKPSATIVGKKTTLHTPAGIALDSNGNIYVANFGGESVTVFAAGSKGNVAPSATISGTGSGLDQPLGIAVPLASPTATASSTATASATPTATPTPGLGTLSFNPDPLSFGDSALIGKGETKKVTIKNSSSKSSDISVMIIGQETAPPFSIKSQCAMKSLAPGKSCKVSVTFTPPDKSAHMGQLTIMDDAQGAPQIVTLTGTGK